MNRPTNPVGQKIIKGEVPEPRRMTGDFFPLFGTSQPVAQVATTAAATTAVPVRAPAVGNKVLRPTPVIGKKSSGKSSTSKK